MNNKAKHRIPWDSMLDARDKVLEKVQNQVSCRAKHCAEHKD